MESHMAALSIRELQKSFGEIKAVDGVSFDVQAGELYGLLGPNGAGKTTTISMMSGLIRPDGGQVRVLGKDFWSDPKTAQKQMGVVPQEIALYQELSARENLIFWGRLAGLPAKDSKQRSQELLETLALTDRAKDPVKSFSGGMMRRVNIGCALMHRPKLLVLDEPTVGIDPQARLNILDFINGLKKDGTSILYTTHYLEEAETLCDRIGIIDQGKLLAEGTLQELQDRLGGDQIFVLEGKFDNVDPNQWAYFPESFRVLQKADHQLTVSSLKDRHPSECLKDLLDIPVDLENVTFKKPSLNDVFIQLTGRELRE
ncbi:ABC transporter ATP-binding protein [bacterium]|jgi:ABC-2 type transport system ATP-binding protein|nr:ABC transporter ATP-binding protein [bacterium]MDB4746268.1 ABC transporter ATP-binding protein [Verrucomicrobiota bacterium]